MMSLEPALEAVENAMKSLQEAAEKMVIDKTNKIGLLEKTIQEKDAEIATLRKQLEVYKEKEEQLKTLFL